MSIIILHKFRIDLFVVAIFENGFVIVFCAIEFKNLWSESLWPMVDLPCVFTYPNMRHLSVVVRSHPTLGYGVR